MRAIIIRAEHGAEAFAGRLVETAQELLFGLIAVPAAKDRYPASVLQDKGRYIDRVAEGMLRQFSSASAADIATTVTAEGFDARDLRPKILSGRRGHRVLRPCRKTVGKRARHRPEIGCGQAEIEQLDSIDNLASAAKILIGQCRVANGFRFKSGQTHPRIGAFETVVAARHNLFLAASTARRERSCKHRQSKDG